ncbi:MAG: hypothetical protein ABSG87_05260 [Verrucomicrobiota bacterium]
MFGTHEYSAVDLATYLSKKLGKEVKLVNVPVSGVSDAIQQGGMGASMANLLQEMYEGMTKGLFGVEPGHRIEKGTTTLDPHLAKWKQQHSHGGVNEATRNDRTSGKANDQ